MMRAVVLLVALATLAGCRGETSHEPPAMWPAKIVELVLPITNMDRQPRYRPQGRNDFFPDGRDARVPPEGTIARGHLRAQATFFTGLSTEGEPSGTYPMELDRRMLERGKARYDTFCAPCHDRTGHGQGLVPRRGWIPPPTFHSDAMRAYTPGQFFQVITHGIRTMPGYAKQIGEADRWAIAAWVQTLQRAEFARLEDVPPAQRDQLR